jgi:hypothetical protein
MRIGEILLAGSEWFLAGEAVSGISTSKAVARTIDRTLITPPFDLRCCHAALVRPSRVASKAASRAAFRLTGRCRLNHHNRQNNKQ